MRLSQARDMPTWAVLAGVFFTALYSFRLVLPGLPWQAAHG